jgi:hypothetical protein
MAAQPLLAGPGPLLSSPHTYSLTWSGGGRTIMLCVLTSRCEWSSYSPENEGAG